MSLIVRSANLSAERNDKEDKPVLCNQKSFNEAIEVAIKLIDRLDRFDRIFAQE
jgi:hypothetical protein